MTPAKLFRSMAFVYIFWNVVCFFAMAAFDAQNEFYYFRWFTLASIWGSASLVVSTYLSVRRSWAGQPAADFRDGILPAAVIFALGFVIWSLAHNL